MAWNYIANLKGSKGDTGPTGSWNMGVLGPLNTYKTADTAPEGLVTVWSAANATGVGLPEGQPGIVVTVPFGSLTIQTYSTNNGHIWNRAKGSSGWTTWVQIDAGASRGILGPFNEFTNVDNAPQGMVTVWSGPNATAVGMPEAQLGTVSTMLWGNTGLQTFTTTTTRHIWQRSKGSSGWTAWVRIDGGGDSASAVDRERPSSGFKLVPLSVTFGQADIAAPTSRTYRVPVKWNAPITRWRLHVTNRNTRNGNPMGTGISVAGVWFGNHAGNGAFTAAPVNVTGAFTVPDTGLDWASGWRTEPLGGNVERLLSYQYTAATAPPLSVAGAYSTSAMVGADLAPSLTLGKTTALDVWIEAETYGGTPVIAVLGDSLAVGAASTLPGYDSVASVYARSKSALPVHYAVSSDTLSDWISAPSAYKVSRWDQLARPDVCILAMGHNDVYGIDLPLATLQANMALALPIIRDHICTTIVGATITPRDAGSVAEHQVRNDYNTWLKTLVRTGAFRDIFDFDAAVTNGNSLKPEYDGDGIHLNTAGYAAQAATIVRPITTPPVQYVGI